MSPRKARLPKDWQRIRQAQLERDHGKCRRCGHQAAVWDGHRWRGGEVDHVQAGVDNHLELQTLCVDCHRKKTAAEGHAARPKRKRPPERHPGLIA